MIGDLQNPEKVVGALRAAVRIWRADRQTCPGWLVCPRKVRLSIRDGIDAVDNLSLALDTMPETERRDALLELAWRFDCAARPVPSWLTERMYALATPT